MSKLEITQERICAICASPKTYVRKTGHFDWRIILGQYYVCWKCYRRYVLHPKSLRFKDQRLTLDSPPRKHICTDCGNQIGDEYINYDGKKVKTKRTAIHHEQYDENNVLAHTVEVCASCHAKREWTPERKKTFSQKLRKLWKNGVYANRKRKEAA